jgi:hypothetical protein
MAYLNVRERRIEAKIAYLGAPLAGKVTNLQRLGTSTSATGDVVATEWRPASSSLTNARFRDCEVTVTLVALRDALGAERLRDLVREVDGIVFVADADPSSVERNRASVALMRDAIEAASRRDLPVVLQVNKTDLDGAMPAEEVASALDLDALPRIGAAAIRGEGVVETAERTLAEILEVLLKGGGSASDAEPREPTTARPPAARVEGNPLLTALKQVLRDTVSEHVANLEAQSGAADMNRAWTEESARTRASADALRVTVEALVGRLGGVESAIRKASEDSARRLERQEAVLAAIGEVVRSIPGAVERVGEGTRNEVSRVVEARAKAEREQTAATALMLRRTLDGLSADIRSADSRGLVGEVRSAVQGVADQTKVLGGLVQPSTTAVRSLTVKVSELETTVEREVRAAVTHMVGSVEERIEAVRVDAMEGLARTEAKTAELHALITELIDELKKPKKGWFG